MKRLRELTAENIEPQERLNMIVQKIARNMKAEICSFYVLRSDGVLELFATEGLNPKAVHLSELRLGQGLVGTVAANTRALNIKNAKNHPAFAYLPETDEKNDLSFLGVPVLRAGGTLGVLVIQNRNERIYTEVEVELLETVAMVIAEMIVASDLPRISKPNLDFNINVNRSLTLDGQGFNESVGLGHVVLHEPRIIVTDLFNEDSDAELKRLDDAMANLRLSIDGMLSRSDIALEGEHRDVLEAYRMFAYDRGWVSRLEEAIKKGLTAEAAVEKVQGDTRARMMQMVDPYMRERLSDFDDLANRLLHQLMGRTRKNIAAELPKDAILVARNMGAAELLDYPRESIRGLVLEDSAATSHVVIIARAMGIPVVGQTKGVVALSENGDSIIIDGDTGKVHLRPQSSVEHAYAEKARFYARKQKIYKNLRKIPAITLDNRRIKLLMNAGLLVDLPQLEESGAEGIGLFRTELQFMIASTFPRTQEQEKLYRSVYKAIGSKPITFRTLDIGGDKILPYFRAKDKEENPALGWRAIRLTLDRPALMRTQLRALLKASSGRELRVMLPMVTEVSEIYRTRDLIDREITYLKRFGHELPERIKLGAMIEVPALLFQLDELMEAVDFASVGSNDLFQFVMAVDRSNTYLASRFDPFSAPFLRVLKRIIDAGEKNDVPVTLCGELASKPLSAMALLGLGFTRISMTPSSIGPVKAMLLSLDVKKLQKKLIPELEKLQTQTLQPWLLQFAQENNVAL